MSKKKKSILIAVIAAAAALAVIYFAVSVYYQERYLPGTVINSVSCSGMTTAEAEAALIDESDTYVLTLVEREGDSEEIAGSDISLEVAFSDEMDQILEQQNEYTWPAGLFYEESVQVESLVVYDENELDEVLESLSCMDEKNMTDPENAALSEYTEESGYELVAATEGTRLDEDAFKAAVAAAVAGLQSELDLAESGCYAEAEYNEEPEKALNMLEAANRYVNTTITYEFGSSAEVVDGSLISQWILVDDDMNVTLDEEKLTEYVAELADTYNT
ncbi:MAG: peptidoglycan binding domain-containing protein, partial [Lachnospiraceae bacterium]|nr:peptidoglycan binding domain-containing protein [Lachnospiraceae bacterium]